MEEEFRERAVRKIKLRALLGELGVLVFIGLIIAFLTENQIVEMPGFSCPSSMLEAAQFDMGGSWA